MFSSKTTRLLSRIDRCKYQKKKVISFKPKMDERYTVENKIVTHTDIYINCFVVETGEEILKIVSTIDNFDSVAIDEMFMIPNSSYACIELFKKGYDVYVSSIELSYTGIPFEEVLKVMPYCTQIVKCTAVCSVCQKDARYTYKKIESIDSPDNIEVGGPEIYEPRCQLHHNYMRD
jgi:thymidine kinase